MYQIIKQEGHDDPVLLHWLIHEIPSYQTLQYMGLKLVAIVFTFSNKKILKDFTI